MIDPFYIPVAAFWGSAVGSVSTVLSNWVMERRRHRVRRKALAVSQRHKLYKKFIEEASRLYADALATDKTEVANFVRLYAMVSRMRVLSTPAVVEAAEAIVRVIVDTYFEPNMTFRELHDAIRSDRIDVMRTFSEAARDDLRIAL